jgi:alpha-tubulin suppressor-like RCC1 family protein
VRSDGTVWAWGSNGRGELGDGTMTDRSTRVQVSGLSDVAQVAVGFTFSLAVRRDGTVWAWGANDLGQLGDGTRAQRSTPVQVPGLSGVTQIAAGLSAGYAVLPDGGVASWGSDSHGQLGDGEASDAVKPPTRIPNVTGVTQVGAGDLSALARKSDGTVLAWGANSEGELGDGTRTQRPTPQPVPGLAGITQVSGGGDYSVALRADGTVLAWGSNQFFQVTDSPSQGFVTTPTPRSGIAGVRQVSAGADHVLAVVSTTSIPPPPDR